MEVAWLVPVGGGGGAGAGEGGGVPGGGGLIESEDESGRGAGGGGQRCEGDFDVAIERARAWRASEGEVVVAGGDDAGVGWLAVELVEEERVGAQGGADLNGGGGGGVFSISTVRKRAGSEEGQDRCSVTRQGPAVH